MQVSKGPRHFFRVVGAKGRALDWIRYSVPQQLRYYEDGAWFVHKKHIEDVKQLGSSDPLTTTPSGSDDYAILHLRSDAPMVIVEAVWRALAKLHHPDRGGDEETFKRINAAYQRIKGEQDG